MEREESEARKRTKAIAAEFAERGDPLGGSTRFTGNLPETQRKFRGPIWNRTNTFANGPRRPFCEARVGPRWWSAAGWATMRNFSTISVLRLRRSTYRRPPSIGLGGFKGFSGHVPRCRSFLSAEGMDQAFEFVLEIYTIQPLPLEMRPKVIDAIANFVKLDGHLVVITCGREDDEEPVELPFPLSRRDLSRFDANGLRQTDFQIMPGDEDVPAERFVVEYVRK